MGETTSIDFFINGIRRPPNNASGPITMDASPHKSETTRFFLYSWDVVGPNELKRFEALVEKWQGKTIQGWTHPDTEGEWAVVLSDLKAEESIINVRIGPQEPIYEVTIVAFIIARTDNPQ